MSIGATLGPPWASLGVRMLTDDELLSKSSGEIKKPETLNYRTLQPERGGLFDTDVFADPDEGKQLLASGMDVSWSVTPATARFGHIELAQPVVHPYYATHGLAELAAECDWSVHDVRSLVFQDMVLYEGAPVLMHNVLDPEEAAYGAAAFAEVLPSPEQFLVRRILIAPVATRPMVQLPDGGWATSHVNDLYRRVVNRNNRLRRLLELDAPAIIIINEQRMLQEAACHLCFNGFGDLAVLTGPEREPLVSLFELAQSGADRVAEALSGSGPAVGVRAFRVFEAIGFGTNSSRKHAPTPQSRAKTRIDLSLSGSPVPIPEI